MERTDKLPRFGMFALLCVSGIFPAMLYGSLTAGKCGLPDFLAAQAAVALAALLAGALLCLAAGKKGEPLGIVEAVRALVLLYSTAVLLTDFLLFLSTFTRIGARFWSYAAMVVLAAYFASSRGITSLCGSAVVFFVIDLVIDLAGVFLLMFRFQPSNVMNIEFNRDNVFSSSLFLMTELSAMPALLAFKDKLPKKTALPVLAWGVLTPLFAAVLGFVSLGAIGTYADHVRFPFYAASQAVGVGAFQRLDVIFLCARITGAFLLLSLMLCALRETLDSLCPQRYVNKASAVCAAAVAVISGVAVTFDGVREMLLDVRIIAASAVIGAAVIPFVYILRITPKARRYAKRAVSLLLVCCMMTTLCGCDKVQLQDRLIVKGIGIDRENEKYTLSVQYIDNYSDGDKQENKLIKVSGESISAAVSKLKDSTGSEPFLGQNAAIVIGFDTAFGSIREVLDYFVSYSESRPTVRLYLSSGKAEEIMAFERDGKIEPIDHITSISPSSNQNDNRFTVLSVMTALDSETVTPSISVIEVKDNAVRLTGASYISGSGVKKLLGDDYLVYCLLDQIESEAVITHEGASCIVDGCKTKLNAMLNDDGRLYLKAELFPVLRVSENCGRLDVEEIESVFSKHLADIALQSVDKMLHKECCDVYGFGERLNRSEKSMLSERYTSALKDAYVDITVSCRATDN